MFFFVCISLWFSVLIGCLTQCSNKTASISEGFGNVVHYMECLQSGWGCIAVEDIFIVNDGYNKQTINVHHLMRSDTRSLIFKHSIGLYSLCFLEISALIKSVLQSNIILRNGWFLTKGKTVAFSFSAGCLTFFLFTKIL